MKQTWILSVLLATAVWGQDNKLPGAGKTIELDLGKKRVNWTNAKWEVLPLDKSVDLRAFAGLRVTVTTDQPRGDDGVYVALREEDGTWYEHPWAVNLTQKENTGLAKFDDFSPPGWHSPTNGQFADQNMTLDLDKIDAIAFGCVNPFGVGTVKFTV